MYDAYLELIYQHNRRQSQMIDLTNLCICKLHNIVLNLARDARAGIKHRYLDKMWKYLKFQLK